MLRGCSNHVSSSEGVKRAVFMPSTTRGGRGAMFRALLGRPYSKAEVSLKLTLFLDELSRSSIPGPTGLDRRYDGKT